MIAKAVNQALPVEMVGTRPEDVRNIGPVIALTLHDPGFAPDRFLCRAECELEAKGVAGRGVLEPLVVDRGATVTGIEDDVDEVFAVKRLA